MASPPFNIDQSLPGDSDIVSQHPTHARTFRDVVESWLLINHNTQGRHDEVDLDVQSSLSGIDDVVRIWADTSGYLKQIYGSGGSEAYLGVPPASVFAYAGSTAPEGYLLCYGQAISRTTYARLFSIVSVAYGSGDGSTTFNVPDLRGRLVAYLDNMGGTAANRITLAGSGIAGTTFGATGGDETVTIAKANIPNYTLPDTLSVSLSNSVGGAPIGVTASSASTSVLSGGGTSIYNTGQYGALSAAISGTVTSGGSGVALNKMPPTIILNGIIKY